jgi:hypothetical protein
LTNSPNSAAFVRSCWDVDMALSLSLAPLYRKRRPQISG